MACVVLADARCRDRAVVRRPFVGRRLPIVAGGFDIAQRLDLRFKVRIRKDRGIGRLPGGLAGRRRRDLGGRVDRLALVVGGIAPAVPRRGDPEIVVGPGVGRLGPVVAERRNVGAGLGLRLKDRIREDRGIGRLALRRTGRLRRHHSRRVHGLGLDVACVVLADAGRLHAAVPRRPLIGRRLPVVRADIDRHVLGGHVQRIDAVLCGKLARACEEEGFRIVRIAAAVGRRDRDVRTGSRVERLAAAQPEGIGGQRACLVLRRCRTVVQRDVFPGAHAVSAHAGPGPVPVRGADLRMGHIGPGDRTGRRLTEADRVDAGSGVARAELKAVCDRHLGRVAPAPQDAHVLAARNAAGEDAALYGRFRGNAVSDEAAAVRHARRNSRLHKAVEDAVVRPVELADQTGAVHRAVDRARHVQVADRRALDLGERRAAELLRGQRHVQRMSAAVVDAGERILRRAEHPLGVEIVGLQEVQPFGRIARADVIRQDLPILRRADPEGIGLRAVALEPERDRNADRRLRRGDLEAVVAALFRQRAGGGAVRQHDAVGGGHRVAEPEGQDIARTGVEGPVVLEAGLIGRQPGDVVVLAAAEVDADVLAGEDRPARSALTAGSGADAEAVLHAPRDRIVIAEEVLGRREFKGACGHQAIPEAQAAAGVAHEAAARGGARAEELAVEHAAGEADAAAGFRQGDEAAVRAVAVDARLDRDARAAVLHGDAALARRAQAGRKLGRGRDRAGNAEIAEGRVLHGVERRAERIGGRDVEGQRMAAAVVDAAERHIGGADGHILRIAVPVEIQGNIGGLHEIHAGRIDMVHIHVVAQVEPFPRIPDLIRCLRRAVALEGQVPLGRQRQIRQRDDRPGPGAVGSVDADLIVAVPLRQPALVAQPGEGVARERAVPEHVGAAAFAAAEAVAALEIRRAGERAARGVCNGAAVFIHEAELAPGQTRRAGVCAGGDHVIEPGSAEAAAGAVARIVEGADAVSAVGGEDVVEVPEIVVRLDELRGACFGEHDVVEADALQAGRVEDIAGHRDAAAGRKRGRIREAAVPEDLRRIRIAVHHRAALIGRGIAVDHRALGRGDPDPVHLPVGVVEVDRRRARPGGVRLGGIHVGHRIGRRAAEGVGLDRDLAGVVDRERVRHGLKGQIRAVLVCDRQIVVHRDIARIAAEPAGGGRPVLEEPAGIGGGGRIDVRRGSVRLIEGEGGVVLVNVDAVRRRTDLVGNGGEGVGRLVLDLQDAGRDPVAGKQLLRMRVRRRDDDLPFRVVVADAHAGLPVLGAVGDLREHDVRAAARRHKAGRQGQRRAEGRRDLRRHVEYRHVLDRCRSLIVDRIVLVMIGGIDAVDQIRRVRVGIDLRAQMQTAELLLVQEAGARNGQQAGDDAVAAVIQIRLPFVVQPVDALLQILGDRAPRGDRLLLRGIERAAADVDRPVDLAPVGIDLAGVVAELDEHLVCIAGAAVEHAGVQIQIDRAAADLVKAEVEFAEGELGLLGDLQQLDRSAERAAAVVGVLLHGQNELVARGERLRERQAVEGQQRLRTGGDGRDKVPFGNGLPARLELDHGGLALAGADGGGAGIGELHLAAQPGPDREIVICERQNALADRLLARAEGDGVEAEAGGAVRHHRHVGILARAHVKGEFLQRGQAALGQNEQLRARASVLLLHRPGGHLQVREGQLVGGAGVAAGRDLFAEIGLLGVLAVHIVGDAVLVDLQVPHGQDRRRAPGLLVPIPPGDEDRVGLAVGDRRGVDRGQIRTVGAEGDLGAGRLAEDRLQGDAAAAGGGSLEVGLENQVAVAAHFKQAERLHAGPVDVGGQEAEVCIVGIGLRRAQRALRVNAVAKLRLCEIAVLAAVEIDDRLQQRRRPEAVFVQRHQIQAADQRALGVAVDVAEGDRDRLVRGLVEVGGLRRVIEQIGLAVERDRVDVFDLSADVGAEAGGGTELPVGAVKLVEPGLRGPVEDRVGKRGVVDRDAVEHLGAQAVLRRKHPGLEHFVFRRPAAGGLAPDGVAAREDREEAEAVRGLQRLHRARGFGLQIQRARLDTVGASGVVCIADPGHAQRIPVAAHGEVQIRASVAVQDQIRRGIGRVKGMDQAGAGRVQIARHDQAAEHELRRALQLLRIDEVGIPACLGKLIGIAVGQSVDQAQRVAGGVVAGELERVGRRRREGAGGAAGAADGLRGGDIRRPAHADKALAVLRRLHVTVARFRLRARDAEAVELRILGRRDPQRCAAVAERELGRRLGKAFRRRSVFDGDLAVEVELDLLVGRGEFHVSAVGQRGGDVRVQRDLAVVGAAAPGAGRDLFFKRPALILCVVVGIRFLSVGIVEGEPAGVLEDIGAVGVDELLVQRPADGRGIGGLGPELRRAVCGRGRDVPGEIAAGALLRALHAEGDHVHREAEEQRREVEAERDIPFKARDVEALVGVGVLEIAAERHRDRNAGLEEELKLQQLHADARADLETQRRGDVEAVEDEFALRLQHGLEVFDRRPGLASGLQLDIDILSVILEQHFLLAAVAGQAAGHQRIAGQLLVVVDAHEDHAVEIRVEAAQALLKLEDQRLVLAGGHIRGRALLELRDLHALHRTADAGERGGKLDLRAELEVDVEGGTRREPRLRRKFDAERRRDAGLLEVVGIVDRVELEHDRKLHGEGGLDLLHLRRALLRLLEGVVVEGVLLHELAQIRPAAAERAEEAPERGILLKGRARTVLFRFVFAAREIRVVGRIVLVSVHPAAGSVLGLLKDRIVVGRRIVRRRARGHLAGRDRALVRIVRIFLDQDRRDRLVRRGGHTPLVAVVVDIAVGRGTVRGGRGLLAGVVGFLRLADRQTDRKADLIAVDDDRGVIAEREFQTGHLGAEPGAEFLQIDRAAGPLALGAAGAAGALQIDQTVVRRLGAHPADGIALQIDLLRDRRELGCRLDLLLDAQRKGGAPDEGAEEGVHLLAAGCAVIVDARAGLRRILTRHRDGAAGHVLLVEDRDGVGIRNEQLADVVRHPGIGRFRLGIDDLVQIVRVADQLLHDVHLHAAHVAAERDVDVVRQVCLRAVHDLVVEIQAGHVAECLLLLGQITGASRIRDRGGERRQDLRPVAGGCALRHGHRPGRDLIVDLQEVLMDLAVHGLVRLERALRVVAVETAQAGVVAGDRKDIMLLIVVAADRADAAVRFRVVAVAVIVQLGAEDMELHRVDRVEILLAVVVEIQLRHRQIGLGQRDRRVAGIGAAVEQDHVLGIHPEVHGLHIGDVARGIDAVALVGEVGVQPDVLLLRGERGAVRQRAVAVDNVVAAADVVLLVVPDLQERAPGASDLAGVDVGGVLLPGHGGGDVDIDFLDPVVDHVDGIGLALIGVSDAAPHHRDVVRPVAALFDVADLDALGVGHEHAVLRHLIAGVGLGRDLELRADVEVARGRDAALVRDQRDRRRELPVDAVPVGQRDRISGLVGVVRRVEHEADAVAGRVEVPAPRLQAAHVDLGDAVHVVAQADVARRGGRRPGVAAVRRDVKHQILAERNAVRLHAVCGRLRVVPVGVAVGVLVRRVAPAAGFRIGADRPEGHVVAVIFLIQPPEGIALRIRAHPELDGRQQIAVAVIEYGDGFIHADVVPLDVQHELPEIIAELKGRAADLEAAVLLAEGRLGLPVAVDQPARVDVVALAERDVAGDAGVRLRAAVPVEMLRDLEILRGVGVVAAGLAAGDQRLPILPVAVVVGAAREFIDDAGVVVGTGVGRADELRRRRLLRLHLRVAPQHFAVRQQRVFGHGDPIGGLFAVRAGEQGRKVPAAAVLGKRRRPGDRDRDPFCGERAALVGAAALQGGQLDGKAPILVRVVCDQRDRDLDLADRAGKGQFAGGCGVIDAGLRAAVDRLVTDRDVVARIALAPDRELDARRGTLDSERFVDKAERGSAASVVVRNHQRQRVARAAELAALAARDRKERKLRQLGELVVERGDADVLDGFAVSEGQLEFIEAEGLVDLQLTVAGLRHGHDPVRQLRRRGDRLVDLAEQGLGAIGLPVHAVDAAQIRAGPIVRLKIPEQRAGQLDRRADRLPEILDILPFALIRRLPAVRIGPNVLGQGGGKAVALLRLLLRVRRDRRAAGLHLQQPARRAERLIGRDRVGVFHLDPQVVSARGSVIIDEGAVVRAGRNRRGERDLRRDSADRAAETVDRDHDLRRQRLPVGVFRAGLADVRLIAAKGKGAEGIGVIPVFVDRDLAFFGLEHHGLRIRLVGRARLLRPELHGQHRAEHQNAEQQRKQPPARLGKAVFLHRHPLRYE